MNNCHRRSPANKRLTLVTDISRENSFTRCLLMSPLETDHVCSSGVWIKSLTPVLYTTFPIYDVATNRPSGTGLGVGMAQYLIVIIHFAFELFTWQLAEKAESKQIFCPFHDHRQCFMSLCLAQIALEWARGSLRGCLSALNRRGFLRSVWCEEGNDLGASICRRLRRCSRKTLRRKVALLQSHSGGRRHNRMEFER